MGYSDDPTMVRVDFFRESGRWYAAEAVRWTGEHYHQIDMNIQQAFAKSLRDHFKDDPTRLSDMDAVCLEPYHEYSHPICLKRGEWIKD